MVNNKLKGKIVEQYGSQADFAQKIGVDDSFISRVVHNRRVLSEEEKQVWAESLYCDVSEIFIHHTNIQN